jgi:hypothetical protein
MTKPDVWRQTPDFQQALLNPDQVFATHSLAERASQ